MIKGSTLIIPNMMGLYLFFLHLTILLAVGQFAALCYPLLLADDVVALNCGSSGNSTAIDGRQWTSDVASRYIILQGSRGRRKLCEINFLRHLSHPNIVKLLGFCCEGKRLFLVYKFMQKGSLDNHLFGRGPSFPLLQWEIRLRILIGAVRGLAYLHSSESPIIYRDFKSSNILLDVSYNARITDFGLARFGPATNEETHVSTRVVGTYGYAAPEYIATGQLCVASDVYAVGVVMAEMLTGLRASDACRGKILTDRIRPYFVGRRKFESIMDVRLKGMYPTKVACNIAQLSLKCLQREPKRRPSMQQVVEILESATDPKEPR